jgi:hypothetical protein
LKELKRSLDTVGASRLESDLIGDVVETRIHAHDLPLEDFFDEIDSTTPGILEKSGVRPIWDRDSDARLDTSPTATTTVKDSRSQLIARHAQAPDIERPNTSMGLSTVCESVCESDDSRTGMGKSKYDDILPVSIGRRSASRTPRLMWVSASISFEVNAA